ncbi:hypothetical protein [Streptomyces sp. SBT349]|uniref:hypothetical protein n=1 Tax=Streptomyces sp. SBT349 TaxID=1580539 RepID=UPI00066C7ED2|nr:hypothetical protein [Streptomyces sp. SBT349]
MPVTVPPPPDQVHLMTEDGAPRRADALPAGRFEAGGAWVSAESGPRGLVIRAGAGPAGIARAVLTWRGGAAPAALVLGDAWERSYGDLQWRHLQPERVLPWYFLACDRAAGRTTGMGVATGAGAMCSWTVDEECVSLWLDLRSGGLPLLPGDRVVEAATVIGLDTGERPFAALGELCAALCPEPLLPPEPVVGSNNWYYAYGRGFGPEAVLRDARTVVEYAGGHRVRPFCVIDDGWTEGGGTAPGGPWDRGLPGVFDDMAGMAAAVAGTGARPGLWFRPLLSRVESAGPRPGVARDSGFPLDPSLPVALDAVAADLARFRAWGYELIKHDFSTYDVFGRFAHPGGPPELAEPGWSLADRSRTSAEILVALYRTVAEAAGDALIIGCNTVGHLAAGLVHIQRTGDDTSGREWERTRRMGVNTLAFRLPHHNRLYAVDADCVPCTPATDWELDRRFLDLVARSGTALFVSVDPAARTRRADADLAAGVQLALDGGTQGGVEPLDWLTTTAPTRWRAGDETLTFRWSPAWGATPLPV